MLMVWSVSLGPTIAEKMASGIDVQTITMLRQLPRNRPTISDTSSDEMIASRTTPLIAPRTNTDWSKSIFRSIPSGAAARTIGSCSRVASTTANVDVSAFLRMARYVARRPLTRTTFSCTAYPSRTRATSPSSS